jgi:AGZA family xanthine/uracil permease-like MFS transporter
MLKDFFKLEELGTNVRQEIIAGVTTFVTMAYIIIVNPKILEAAGIPFGPSMVATILSAFFGTLAMGIYAKRPFAIAPYMGENAFIAFTVVKVLGYSWQTAIGAIFIGGVIFTIITILRIRSWLANSIPEGLKIGFAVGIGLFLTFIGLNETGIVTLGVPGAPVHVGNLKDASVLLAIFGFLFIGFLMIKRVTGAILLGILIVTFLAFLLKIAVVPDKWVSMPPSIMPIFLKLDIMGALTWGFFAVILTVFVMDFVDTLGTLIGVSYRAGFLDENGNLPEIEKPMLCDALATVVGALLGTTTTGTYIESAAGIEAGGKSGLTSVVTAILFLIALFFAPFFTVIPAYAYGPALIIVGMLMLTPITKIKFDDLTEVVPVFSIIILMSFTYNLGIGMTAGFVVYPLMKVLSGRAKEVPAGLWVLGALSVLFFIFFPY